jgi:hypothetical protein
VNITMVTQVASMDFYLKYGRKQKLRFSME